MNKVGASLLAAALFSAPVCPADLTGTWVIEPGWIKSDAGVTAHWIVIFSPTPTGGFKGSLDAGLGATPFHVQVLGNSITLELPWFDPRETVPIKGTQEGDRLHLAVAGLQMPAHRLSDADISDLRANFPKNINVQKLPLPPLRDLPGNGLARTPPMGWSSWNKFADAIDDRTVRAIADAMVSNGLRDVGYTYVNIDDGWQGRRDSNGMLQPNRNFPDMKALADYVHAKGLKFGIYSSPGPYTCGNRLGSHGYERQDGKMFAQWGVDYLKYDACSAAALYLTGAEMRAAYQKMGDALQASGRSIVYSLSLDGKLGVIRWARKAGANLWRTADDISDDWAAISRNGFDMNGSGKYAGPGGWNDPDMLEVGNGGMTPVEYRTHMTLWCISAAPLILGSDVRTLSRFNREILLNREVIAVDQDVRGIQGWRVNRQDEYEVWMKPLSAGELAVALFNRGATKRRITIRWAELGLIGPQRARDLWKHADLGRFAESYSADVPSHGSLLMRLKPAS